MPPTCRGTATAAFLTDRFEGQPFTLAEATAVGVGRGRLRSAVDAGELIRMRHGVFAPAATVAALHDPMQRHAYEARALVTGLRGRPGGLPDAALLSHTTATAVRGLPYPGLLVPRRWPVQLSDTRAAGGRQATGWIRHDRFVPPQHRTVVDGLPVTGIARTAVDVALTTPFAAALPVVDGALRQLALGIGALTADPTHERDLVRDQRVVNAVRSLLLRTLAEAGGTPGRQRARRAIGAGDPAAENGFESCSRARLLLAGLPRPDVGYPVMGDDGRWYWADLAWPQLRVLAEADGRVKYTDLSAVYAEKVRQEALERAGWIVVRWTWHELARTPEVVVARVAAALERARERRRAA